ncbi:MAG: hypothetical protein H7318_18055 [Oligoflexus sp.]|nr:hypothetical protein [Oligoflexus sp.]
MNTQKRFVIIATLLTAFLVIFMLGKSRPNRGSSTLPPQSRQAVGGERVSENVMSGLGSTSKRATEADVLRKHYNRMMQTGLREIPSKLVGTKLQVKIQPITFPLWCTLGDFDLLKASTDKLFKKDFLISIEPLNTRGSPVSNQRLSLAEFSSPKVIFANFNDLEIPKDYGVYICLDRKNTNECGSKKVLGSKDWNKSISNHTETDRILYFQMITISSHRSFLIPGHKWDDSTIGRLKKTLHSVIEDDDSIDAMQKFLVQLGSVPARIKHQVLELPLPYKDPNCSI